MEVEAAFVPGFYLNLTLLFIQAAVLGSSRFLTLCAAPCSECTTVCLPILPGTDIGGVLIAHYK